MARGEDGKGRTGEDDHKHLDRSGRWCGNEFAGSDGGSASANAGWSNGDGRSTLDILTPEIIGKLKREAEKPDRGASYVKPNVLLAVIHAYESERDRRLAAEAELLEARGRIAMLEAGEKKGGLHALAKRGQARLF